MAYANAPYLLLKAMVTVILGFVHLTVHKGLLHACSVLGARKTKHSISKESVCTLYSTTVFVTKYFSTIGQNLD